ncbi:MAG: GntR family transcriptional regulator [Deltaproteobacteria bacterium]|nr:GntR family transcriptional regulator [Deltaproteobacteria bacterium]
MLNPQSPVPLYHQLADIIRAKIRAGEYRPGSRIPSETSLASTYGIGRPTARQATELLVRKRILIRKRGSGTFVNAQKKKEIDLFSLAGTIASFRKEGISVATRILQKTRLEVVDQNPGNPFSGQQAYFLSRLNQVEDVPVLIEDIYLNPTLFAGIDRIDLQGQSLSQVVDEFYYMQPTSGKQNFKIGYLIGKKAMELGVAPSKPILVVKRYLHFARAENAIYSELYCRTDQFVFSQTIGGLTHD